MVKHLVALLAALLAFAAPAFAEEEEARARVVTYKSNPVKCIAPIAVRVIDGRLRQLPATGFDIEPGEHSIHGTATVELVNCPPVKTARKKPVNVPALDWFFESGKVYYVGLDYSRPQREEWRIVVWRVEYEDGEVVFDITDPETRRYN